MSTHTLLPHKPEAVLFDLDGTLIDSVEDLGQAANILRQHHDLPNLPVALYRPLIGSGARGILTAAFPDTDPNSTEFDQLCTDFYDLYAQCMGQQTRTFEGVDALLRTLEQHQIHWGIVTNKSERFAIPLIAALPELRQAPVLICGDTLEHAKPHPLPLQEAARRLGVSPTRSIYVGDDRRDMLAGQSAGMRTVAALYGFIPSPEATLDWPADQRIDQPLDLLNLLHLA